MGKNTKIWLIIAASCILLGIIIFGSVMTILKWDFTQLSTNTFETKNHKINEDFKSISINTDTAEIKLVPSESSESSAECYEQNNLKHSVEVKDGTLVIQVVDTRKWYEYIGINFGSPKITVYIPQGNYGALQIKSSTGGVEIPKDFVFESISITESTGDVKCYASAEKAVMITTSTGDISVENISAASLSLSVSTGKLTVSDVNCEGDVSIDVSTGKSSVSDVKCKNLFSNGDTGDISLNQVVAKEKISIERSTGDVKFDGCDAAEIFVKTDTGDVKGTLLSEKVFIVDTNTGKKEVPKTTSGGRCEITTDTGDIKISIEQ